MFFFSFVLFSAFLGNSFGDSINPVTTEELVQEGRDVHLFCKYDGTVYNLQWYRQYPRSKPEFLLYITPEGSIFKATPPPPRMTISIDKVEKLVDLKISSADVTDSALYYCAMNAGGQKLIFGSGTTVFVQSREKHDPSYYSLKSSNTTACLATDFSAHNATAHLESFNKTEATRVKGDSYYSQVALGENCTEGGGSEKCEANWYFDTDAKINFLSLTILGLRILFLKTIVFNVLMTLRLWMS